GAEEGHGRRRHRDGAVRADAVAPAKGGGAGRLPAIHQEGGRPQGGAGGHLLGARQLDGVRDEALTLRETSMHWQLLTVALDVAAPVPAEKEKKDEDKIQGTWAVVSLEAGGKKAPDDQVKNVTFVFKDDTVTINDPKREEKAKIKLDASKKPKAI